MALLMVIKKTISSNLFHTIIYYYIIDRDGPPEEVPSLHQAKVVQQKRKPNTLNK